MSNTLPPILNANRERQAVPSIRGYVYQIWHSLYAWITLNDDEIIRLEGAEDFDIYAPDEVQTVQVGDTKGTGSVTLRTKKVLESLRNFWETQGKNPEHRVYLRYLTTSDRGKEQDDTLGSQKGLDCWDSCKKAGTDLVALRTLVITSLEQLDNPGEYGGGLINFLKQSTDDEIRARLIGRVTWDTGRQPMEIVQELVKRKLILHGNKFQVPPRDSEEAMPRLLKKVCDTVTGDSDRQLDKIDFLKEFEAGANEFIPRSEARRLRNRFYTELETDSSMTSSGEVFHSNADLALRPSPLPKPCLARRAVVDAILDRLTIHRIVVVRGSVNTGKTTVAALVSAAQSDWIWLDLRGRTGREARERLIGMFSLVQGSKHPLRIVLDDFDFRLPLETYENHLLEFLSLVLSGGGQVLITTQAEIPSRLISCFSEDISDYQLPWLSTEEIKSFAATFGCLDWEMSGIWAYCIKSRTGGHPKLVHAWLHDLKSLGWPAPETVSIDEPRGVDQVRREARQDLITKISSEHATILIYRLSVLNGPFRRDHAVALGAKQIGSPPAAVSRPGEMFDQLLGPWIEEVAARYYRISPLLGESATAVYSPADVLEINDAIAHCVGECGDLTHYEARAILVHGIHAGSKEPVLQAVLGLINMAARSADWPAMASHLIPIALLAPQSGQILFPTDPSTSVLLRDLQFQIALVVGDETLTLKIAELWEQEFDSIADVNLRLRMRLLFVMRVISHLEVHFPFEFVVTRALEAISIVEKAESLGGKDYAQGTSRSEMTEHLLASVGARCRDISELEILLSNLETNQYGVRNAVLSLLARQISMVVLLIDRAWFSIAHSPAPDWPRVTEFLQRVVEDGKRWSTDFLIAAAGRSLSIVQDEYLKNPEEALRTLDEVEGALSAAHPLMDNSRAVVMFNLRRYDEALGIWDTILSTWSDGPIWVILQSCRWAQIAESKRERWDKAAEWARIGYDKAFRANLRTPATGFLADEAFARWKSGDANGAIHGFAEVLERFATIPDPDSDLHAYTLIKRVGHSIAWIHEDANKKDEFGEPPPACFSNPEVDEEIKNFPIASDVDLWRILAQIECEKRLGRSIFSTFEKVSSGSTLHDPLWWLEYFRVRHSVVNLELNNLILFFAESLKKFALARRETGNETSEGVSQHLVSLFKLLLAAFGKAAHDGRLAALPVERWRADIAGLGIKNDKLERLFKVMEESALPGYQAGKEMISAKDSEIRIINAMIVLTFGALEPETMFLASVYAVIGMSTFWGEVIDIEIADLVSSGWSKIAREESFIGVVSPSIVEQILNACNDESTGFQKSARVILAARHVVSTHIDDEIDNELKRLAK